MRSPCGKTIKDASKLGGTFGIGTFIQLVIRRLALTHNCHGDTECTRRWLKEFGIAVGISLGVGLFSFVARVAFVKIHRALVSEFKVCCADW